MVLKEKIKKNTWMRLRMELLKMYAGYVIDGIKRNLNLNFKMINKKIHFNKTKKQNQFLYIFNLKNMNHDILDQINRNNC